MNSCAVVNHRYLSSSSLQVLCRNSRNRVVSHQNAAHASWQRVLRQKLMLVSRLEEPWQTVVHRRTRKTGGRPVALAGSRTAVGAEEYQRMLQGGDQVLEVMAELQVLLEDLELDGVEAPALQMAAASVVHRKLDGLDQRFFLALDFMMLEAKREGDEEKEWILAVIKDQVLGQLSQRLPPQVQVVDLLVRTESKETRHAIFIKAAGGGGNLVSGGGGEEAEEVQDVVGVPAANLVALSSQADDLIQTMEERPEVLDYPMLARLVLVREEARALMGGGILDDRNNNRGLENLPAAEVQFLSSVMALGPTSSARERLKRVMCGLDEGAPRPLPPAAEGGQRGAEEGGAPLSLSAGKAEGAATSSEGSGARQDETRSLPVRPGVFTDTVRRVLSGVYESPTTGGLTVQQLEWIRKTTMEILQGMAFPTSKR